MARFEPDVSAEVLQRHGQVGQQKPAAPVNVWDMLRQPGRTVTAND